MPVPNQQDIQNLTAAITGLTTNLGNIPSGRPPPASTPTASTPRTTTTTSGAQIDLSKAIGDHSKMLAALNKMTAAVDKFGKVGGAAAELVNSTFDMANKKYDPIQKQLGGIAEIGSIVNESSKKSVGAIDDLYSTFYGNQKAMGDLAITRNGQQINALTAFYGDASELGRSYMAVRDELAQRQGLMLNKMSREDTQKLAVMEKGLKISSRKVGEILERQISLTGEASTKTFDEISAYSKSVADATGVSYQEIAGQVADIITDVERFGNVQVDEAARIAGALNQLGLSYQGFGGMVDKFMSFDNAAESLGNLTTVFGIHFDAMEMMQLANEDQEEFLYRMREAFMDSGKAVEDMTLAEKKLAAQQMGMGVQDFENFMQEDRILDDLTGATDKADVSKGFQTMTDQMVQVPKDAKQMEQYMQNKIMDPLSKSAKSVGDDFESMKTKMVLNPEKYLPGYQQLQQYMTNAVKGTFGTDEYENAYAGNITLIESFVTRHDGLMKKPLKLLEEVKKLGTKDKITMTDLVDLSQSEFGGAEFATYVISQIEAGASIGLQSAEKVIDDQSDAIEKGLKIDPARASQVIRDNIDQVSENVMNDLSSDPPGMLPQNSPSLIGNMIALGLTDFDHKGELAGQITGKIGSISEAAVIASQEAVKANPLLDVMSNGSASVKVESPSLIRDMGDLNQKAILAATTSDKKSEEKMKELIAVVDTLKNSMASILEKDNIVVTDVNIDGDKLFKIMTNYNKGDKRIVTTTASEVV